MSINDKRTSPSEDYPWMVLTGFGDRFFFRTDKDAIEYANNDIPDYCDPGWMPEVKNFSISKVEYVSQQANRRERPDESELDEDLMDSEGFCWEEFEYYCEYKMKPLGGDKSDKK